MNTLALDTSTDSLGLALQTTETTYLRVGREGLKHAQTLALQVRQLLDQANLTAKQLDLVVVAVGPGSFTGLRIGIATAKGLARGAASAIVGICTLDTYAKRNAAAPSMVIPLIDARKQRVYTAFYDSGVRSGDLLDVPPEIVRDRLVDTLSTGTGQTGILTGPYAGQFFERYGEKLPQVQVDPAFSLCAPYSLLQLGVERYERGGSDPNVSAQYLRLSEAEEKRGVQPKRGPDAVRTDG